MQKATKRVENLQGNANQGAKERQTLGMYSEKKREENSLRIVKGLQPQIVSTVPERTPVT